MFSCFSCAFLSNAKYDKYGRIVSKHPSFELKDKKGFVYPQQLDTLNIYKLHTIYDRAEGIVYSSETPIIIRDGFMQNYNKGNYYL